MVELKFALALAGAALLLWYWLADDVAALRRGRRARDALLVALGLISCASWWNFGRFHYDRFVHYYDFYHYYMGAKYAPELGYTRLYRCTVVAEAEIAHLGPRLERLRIRDLRDNSFTTAAELLAHPERCKRHFTPARWQAFMRDSDFFRRASPWPYWVAALGDHGYNATPVWGIVPGFLANHLGPINRARIFVLALVDPLLLLAMMGLLGWAFGWRALCVALLFFGTNVPGDYWFIGGAYFRMDWLLATVASICFMKRGRSLASGVAIGVATLLRIFPGFVAAALVLKIAVGSWRARRLSVTRAQRRFILGGILSVAILVPVSMACGGGPGAWRGFVRNSEKHLSTPTTNNMGWKSIVAYQPSKPAVVRPHPHPLDPQWQWKQDLKARFRHRWVLFAVGLLAYLILLGVAVDKHEDWVALVAGVGLILVAVEITCYYFIVFLAFALLWDRLRWSGFALAVASALSCAIPSFWTRWDYDRHVDISAVYLVFVVVVTAALARNRKGSGGGEGPAAGSSAGGTGELPGSIPSPEAPRRLTQPKTKIKGR